MNTLLNLSELRHENKTRERARLDVFSTVLEQCHSQIKRYNKDHKVTECYFSVPMFIAGKPPYEINVLINYLLHHLRDNGLFAEKRPGNQIFISWSDDDIDIHKYENRKNRIKSSETIYSSNVPVNKENMQMQDKLK